MSLEIKKMYVENAYSSIINKMNCKIINKEYLDEEDIILYGCTLAKVGLFQYAEKCFQNVSEMVIPKKYLKYYAICEYACGKYEKSDELFKKLVEKHYRISVSNEWRCLLDFEQKLELFETEDIRYHFEASISHIDRKRFCTINEESKTFLMSVFKVRLPKKIDIYGYKSECDKLGNRLSYANPALCMIHTNIYHTYGHELVHVIYSYLYPYMQKSRFIDEGIAVYFNREPKGNIIEHIKKYHIPNIDIKEMWEKFQLFERDEAYTVSGLFIGYIIHRFSMDKFLKFIEIQTLENARQVFGISFDKEINCFENLLNGET